MTPVTVLITGIGSTTAISVAKGLKRQTELDVRIVGTDINRRDEIAGSSFCDQFYTIPEAVRSEFIPSLLDICATEGVQVIFPVIDVELEMIAARVDAFRAKGIHVWLSDAETIRVCNDKYRTYHFFIEHGIPTAKTWLPEEITARRGEWKYPLIVKPVSGRGSVDVLQVRDELELTLALRKVKNPLIQEYLEGTEFTIDVLTDNEARPVAAVPRTRDETKAGISYKGRTVRDQQLIEQASRIAQTLRIKGPCNIQCRVGDSGPKFFEVNPRFSGALPLTIAAGVNSPYLLVKLAVHGKLDRSYFEFQEGVYMARYWEEVFYGP